MLRARARIAPVAAIVAAVAVGGPPAAQARSNPLDVIGDVRALTVPLGYGETGRQGRSSVLVRNRSSRRILLRVRYARSSPGGVTTALAIVTTSAERRATFATPPAGVIVPLAAGDVAHVHLRLTATYTPVGRAAGVLVLAAERGGPAAAARRRSLGAPVILPVKAIRAEEGAVVVEPASVSIPVERLVPELEPGPRVDIGERSGETSVIVRGDGVESLGQPWPQGVVRREDGRTLTVDVVREEPAGEAQRRLVLRAGTGGESGAYTGDMVFGANDQPLRLKLTVHVRSWFWGAVLLVFLGAVLGQFLPRIVGVRRSRQWLRAEVRRSIARYAWYRRRRPEPAGYDLPDVVGRWAWDPDNAAHDPPDDEARGLLRRIGQARSGEDLEEAGEAVDTFRAEILRWARVENEARLLADLVEQPLPHLAGQSFSGTRPYKDAQRLLAKASSDPEAGRKITVTGVPEEGVATPGATDVLVRDLRDQRLALDVCVSIWKRQCAGDWGDAGVPPETRLDAIWKPRHDHADRKSKAFAELMAALKAADRQLAELAPEEWPDVMPTWTRTVLADRRPTEDSGGPGHPRQVWRWLRRRLHFSVSSMAGLELILTLLSIAVPCAVYMLTLYDGTWGADPDLITAFAAGFAGKVIIDWSGLAVFRPLWGWWRERRGGESGGGGGGGGEQRAEDGRPAQPVPPAVSAN